MKRINYRQTFSYTPEILATLDDPAVYCFNILCRSNDGEWDGLREHTPMVGVRICISLDWGLVDANNLSSNNLTNLHDKCTLERILHNGMCTYPLLEVGKIIL